MRLGRGEDGCEGGRGGVWGCRRAWDTGEKTKEGSAGWERAPVAEEEVEMIFHAADFEGFEFVVPGDPADEREEAFVKGGCELRAAVFGGEIAMKVRGDVRHAGVFSRPFGTASISFVVPALKCRAIVRHPYGMKERRLRTKAGLDAE